MLEEVYVDKRVSIDERVLDDAMHLSGLESVDDVIQQGLNMLVNIRLGKQRLIRKYKGKLKWDTEVIQTKTARERIRAVS